MLVNVTLILSLVGEMKIQGEATYCLGLAYYFAGENQKALSVSLF